MIYIVSGYMRSGTSMMMEALEAGGMDVCYSERREKDMFEAFKDGPYLPNRKYYELQVTDFLRKDFVQRYEGRCVKVLAPFLHLLPVADYNIVYMNRDTDKIFQSYAAAINANTIYTDRAKWDREIQLIREATQDRRSCKCFTDFYYDYVVDNPLPHFKMLKTNGWPIDETKAAAIPDKGKRRYERNAGKEGTEYEDVSAISET